NVGELTLDDLDTKDKKCTYLRSLILTSDILPPFCCQTPLQVIVEKPVSIVQQSLLLQDEDAEAVVNAEVTVNLSTFRSILKDTYLPENASQLLRYYELWNKPYDKWLSLHEYLKHLHDVKKDLVHDSFKKEIEILKKLFSDDHPAQQRLTHLECQLKMKQMSRKIKRKIAKISKLLTKKEIVKKEIEITQDSLVVGRYNRINQYYEDFYEIGLYLVKRNLSADNNYSEFDYGKVKKAKK
ncbi:8616_t:CDS:2, partial [Funneliformis caledonium]